MKDEKRTANMRDRKKAADTHFSFEEIAMNVHVTAQKELVQNKFKRKFKKRSQEKRGKQHLKESSMRKDYFVLNMLI